MLNLDRIEEIIAGVEIGFFLTRTGKWNHGRPMATLTLESDGSLWFIIHQGSDLEKELNENPLVSISYNDIYSNRYLLVNGIAQLIKDERKQKTLWHPQLSKWGFKSADDRTLLLVKVYISEAECWNQALGHMEEEESDKSIIPIPANQGNSEQFLFKNSQ